MLVWSVILLVIGVHAAMKPGSPTLFLLWRNSGLAWRDGGSLYNGTEDATTAGFRYGPLFGALFVPLTWMPVSVGAVLWRLGNAGVFLASLAWWLRHGAPIRLTERQTGILFTISAILAISNLFTGQLNLLLGALALIAVTAGQRQRWNIAALAVAAGAMMKMYPLALGLLLVVVYSRKMGWRLALMLLLYRARAVPVSGLALCRRAIRRVVWLAGQGRWLSSLPAVPGWRDLSRSVAVVPPVPRPDQPAGLHCLAGAVRAGMCGHLPGRASERSPFTTRVLPRPHAGKHLDDPVRAGQRAAHLRLAHSGPGVVVRVGSR